MLTRSTVAPRAQPFARRPFSFFASLLRLVPVRLACLFCAGPNLRGLYRSQNSNELNVSAHALFWIRDVGFECVIRVLHETFNRKTCTKADLQAFDQILCF